MEADWNPLLVALSIAIAVLASCTALDLAGRVTAARGRNRSLWMAGGAFAMGTGIWSMHFLGMLAWQMPVPISYDVGLVILSAALAILGSGFALLVVSSGSHIPRLALAAPVMGAAIAGMHYTGMAGMRGDLEVHWQPVLVAASIVIAVVASYAALWMAFRFRSHDVEHDAWKKLAAGGVMGLAIVGMHYTGMAAAHAMPAAGSMSPGSVLPTGGLATAVVAITLIVLAMATMVARLDRELAFTTSLAAENARLYRAAAAEIAERKRSDTAVLLNDQQLRQTQRIEAVGRLAGGVAHDFNSLLTAIRGHADLVIADLPAEHRHRGDLVEISRAAERAAGLTRQLLAFSRRQILKPQVIDLNGVVTAAEPTLQKVVGQNVAVFTDLASDLYAIRADPVQLEQVLINLAMNARDAMPAGGELHIRTANADRCEDQYEDLPDGRVVVLLVSDTGCGMEDRVAAHIFEPFYTTKEQGRGDGLGLSTVYGIVRQTNGSIRVSSRPGEGTTFQVCFPALEHGAHDAPLNTVDSASRGSETVLLVEDEVSVRALVRKLLRRSGYTVLEAEHVNDAIRIATEHRGAIDLLLTDVAMPIMNGRELAAAVALLRDGIRILYMSGYTEDALLQEAGFDNGVGFLAKPFTSDELIARVRRTLDQPRHPRVTAGGRAR